MANWSTLKTAVADVINANGNQEITGQLLQNVLNNIITNVGENSTFAGVATPSTNPGAPDGNVFYLTSTAGTYSNFSNIIVNEGEAVILEWRGSWAKKTTGFATTEQMNNKEDKKKVEKVNDRFDSIIRADVMNVNNATFEKGHFDSLVFNNNSYINSETGQPISSAYRKTSIFLKVREGDIVSIKGITGYIINNYITAYDFSGNIMLSASVASEYDAKQIDTLYKVPYGVQSIRITMASGDNPEIHVYGVMNGITRNTPILPLSEIEYEIEDDRSWYGADQQLRNTENVKMHTNNIPVSILNKRIVRIVLQGATLGGYSVIAKDENLSPIFSESYIGEQNDITLQFSEDVKYFVVYAPERGVGDYSGLHIYTATDITYLKDFSSIIAQKMGEIEKSKGINKTTGEIYGAYQSYRLLKTYLKAGKYYMYVPYAGTLAVMWKYEDETYSNAVEEIIGNVSNELVEINIKDGYYAIGWNNGAPNYIDTDPTQIPLLIKGDNHILGNIASSLKKQIDEIATFQKGITLNWVGTGYYDVSGTWVNSPNREVTDFIKIEENTREFIISLSSSANNNAYTLSAYDDKRKFMQEYSILASGTRILVSLNENVKYIRLFKQPSSVMSIKIKGFEETATYIHNGKYVNGLASLTLSEGWRQNEDGTIQSTSNIGAEYPLFFNRFSSEDKIDIYAEIQPLADNYGNFEVLFGKFPALVGTAFGLKLENNKSYISMYEVSNGQFVLARNYALSNITLRAGQRYMLNIQKRTTNVSYFNVMVTDYKGNTETIENLGSGEIISGDTSNEGNGAIYGYMWGTPRIIVKYGGAIIHGFNLNYPIDAKNVKLICTGHSFAEGNSIPNDKDKKFFSLVCNKIGESNTLILGQGGGNESMITWVQSIINGIDSPYILICLGTNDADSNYTCSRYKAFNDYCRVLGMHPIWLTVPPRADVGMNKPIIDNYIRANFDYIDINGVFYDEDGNIDKSMLMSDNVHPTIEAHRRIYNVIHANAPYLFSY